MWMLTTSESAWEELKQTGKENEKKRQECLWEDIRIKKKTSQRSGFVHQYKVQGKYIL